VYNPRAISPGGPFSWFLTLWNSSSLFSSLLFFFFSVSVYGSKVLVGVCFLDNREYFDSRSTVSLSFPSADDGKRSFWKLKILSLFSLVLRSSLSIMIGLSSFSPRSNFFPLWFSTRNDNVVLFLTLLERLQELQQVSFRPMYPFSLLI